MKKTIALTLGLAVSPFTFANEDIDLLQQLFNSGQSVEAYELGLELRSELEGNPKFDYYFGASAVDSGDASQGVFALERVLIQQPNNQAARLELARGYYELEEYQRSRKEFEAVMAANPPEDVKEKIEKYLDALRLRESRYRSSATAFFRVGAGNDTNANAATDETTLQGIVPQNLAGLNGRPIADNSRAQESSFTDITLGANFNIPITTNWAFLGGTDLSATIFSDEPASDFNTTAFNFRGGLQQRINDSHQLNYLASHQAMILADDFYRNTSNVSVIWNWQLDDVNQIQSYARLGQLEYVQTELNTQDTDTTAVGAFYLRQQENMKFKPIFSIGATFGQDEPQRDSAVLKSTLGRDFMGISAGVLLTLNPKSSLRANLTLQESEYDGQQVAFGKAREDDLLQFSLNYDHILSRRWKVNGYFTHVDNGSNIGIYEYDRDRIGVNFTFETR